MSKPRLLLMLNPSENRRLLIERLSSDFEIVFLDEQAVLERSLDSTIATVKDIEVDLIICNLVELGRWRTQITRWRKKAEPVLLPVLALLPKNIVGTLPADVRYQIDELVTVPIDPDELDVRISLLMRSRHLTTQLAQQNKMLEELNTLKTRFVSMVSHEFRAPLSVISGIIQLLQKQESQYSSEKKQDLFQRMQSVVTKLTTLLDDLLILSRNTSSKVIFKPKPVDIQSHCKNLINNFQLSTAKNRKIHLHAQGELSLVNLDISLVETILSNLLSNAIKYSPETAPVNLRIERRDDQIILQVSDQGQGIPLEDQAALFDPFFRAHNVGTIPGTGLGLSILKECVELHRGIVKVDSVVERGTTFVVTLPCNLDGTDGL